MKKGCDDGIDDVVGGESGGGGVGGVNLEVVFLVTVGVMKSCDGSGVVVVVMMWLG